LGLEKSFQEYVEKMLKVTAELKRILKEEGSFYLNLGDTYGGFQGKNAGWPDSKTKANLPRIRKPKEYQKCLLGIPWRIALRMIDEQG